MQQMTMPDFGLVVLIGPSGSGKTTFARKHFQESEVLSSDLYRTVVGDVDRSSQTTRAAFDVIGYIATKRLEARRIAVIDATNLHREHRAVFANLARQQNAPLTAIVFELSENACQRQNAKRTDEEPRPHHVVRRHWQTLKRSIKTLPKEGFRRKFRIKSPEDATETEIKLEPLVCDRRSDTRPLDIIGDVHGCRQELEDLLGKLGYQIESEPAEDGGTRHRVTPSGTRRAVFLGDLVDRGPDSPGTLELVMDMVESGAAIAVQGNHDNKLMRALSGRDVQRTHGLAETMEALEKRPEAFRERVRTFLGSMASHFVLDGGNLVAAHAGMAEHLQNRAGRDVRDFGLYGDSDGSTDEDGLPIRGDWGREYRGPAAVVYGHTPTARPEWVNNTLCIDTGCVWGGPLTALRYPEREIVRVPARQAYQTPAPKAMQTGAQEGPDGQQAADRELDLSELQGVLRINTRLDGTVTVKPDHSAAALETMGRFAVDPRWLIYMPPTMAPCRAAADGELLERPAEAFDHYRKRGVKTVVCQDKHMGSRGIVVVTRDSGTSRRRFGVGAGSHGCTTPGSPSASRADKGADRKEAPAEGAAPAHGHDRRQMLLARITQGAQQRRAEKGAIRSIPDTDARRAAERESRSAYERSPEDHGNCRRVGKNGLKLEKPRLEKAFQAAGEMMAGTAKRLQRDIRYSLAPPDKSAMKIGGNKSDIHAQRPSAASRPASAPMPAIQKMHAQPAHTR